MRKAVITHLKEENYYNFAVLIFVNNKPIGVGAFLHKLSQVRKFMNDCKVESYLIVYEEDYK